MTFERRRTVRYNGGMVRAILFSIILAGLALTSPHVLAGETEADAAIARGRVAYDDGDYETAYKEWLHLAEVGNADAQFGMGEIFRYGGGDHSEDPARAVRWFARAAKQGHPEALDWLGEMYVKGEGVPKDLKRAECLFLHAARRGFLYARWSIYHVYKYLGRNEESNTWLARALEESSLNRLFIKGKIILIAPRKFGPTRVFSSGRPEGYAYLLLAEERGSKEAAAFLKTDRSSLNPLVRIELFDGRLIANKWRALKATPMAPPSPVEDACLPG